MRNPGAKERYLEGTFGLENPELHVVRKELEAREVDFMSISFSEARALQFLIRGFGIKSIVEFGTLFGFSALAMAQVLPDDGHIYTLEKSAENHGIATRFFAKSAHRGKITALNGDAMDLMKKVGVMAPFDMVFIDANKLGYVDYLNWAEAHVRPGGLIVGDNTFLFGSLWGESRDPDVKPKTIEIMREFNRRLADPKKYNSTLIPTLEGMTVAQKLA